jgi:hypothetical protein
LLFESHADGRGKAGFFLGYGFSVGGWHILAAALRSHALENDVIQSVDTPFGVGYVVEGTLRAPDGRRPAVRVVWFIERGEGTPRFVTAYPVHQRKHP